MCFDTTSLSPYKYTKHYDSISTDFHVNVNIIFFEIVSMEMAILLSDYCLYNKYYIDRGIWSKEWI